MDETNEPDENVRPLEADEVQEIINWSVSAAAMIILMHNAPDHDNDEEGIERLEGYIEAIQIMMNNMPDSLMDPAHEVAAEAVADAEEEQELVNQFREELKDL